MPIKDTSRRDFLKKTAYVPPLLLSLSAAPSFARNGSVDKTGCIDNDGPPHDVEILGAEKFRGRGPANRVNRGIGRLVSRTRTPFSR